MCSLWVVFGWRAGFSLMFSPRFHLPQTAAVNGLPVPGLEVPCWFACVCRECFLLSQYDLSETCLTQKTHISPRSRLWRFFILEDKFCHFVAFHWIFFNMPYNSCRCDDPRVSSLFNAKSEWMRSALHQDAWNVSVLEIGVDIWTDSSIWFWIALVLMTLLIARYF